jgi:hypothetical protein
MRIKMAQSMTRKNIETQNRFFVGTGGISSENRSLGFVPGFFDQDTGLIYRSCTAEGVPAPVHLIEGLPHEVVLARNPEGRVCAVKGTLIAGFILDGCFYTREQVADTIAFG